METEANKFYHEQFTGGSDDIDMTLIDLVPGMVSEEHNVQLNRSPSLDEVRRVVFELNGDSARS